MKLKSLLLGTIAAIAATSTAYRRLHIADWLVHEPWSRGELGPGQ